MSPSLPDRRRDALTIDALVADRVPSPPRTRQCGKCQEAHTRCDGRDPCRTCEVRGTLCGYAWSSFSAPPPAAHAAPPARAGYAQHVLYFPPPAKRPARPPDPPLARPPPADGGWAIVPVGTNAPAVTRGGEPGPPVKPCKTCQARNTTCDGVLPVCGSCRTRRLECYIASPATAERPRVQSLRPMAARDKAPLHPRVFPAVPQARSRAASSSEEGKPSRASLSFMLNPAEHPVASTSRGPPRPPELKRPPHPTTPTPLVTPPTPVAPNGMEQAQTRMEIDRPPGPISPLLEPRSASPLSPSSSVGGADLSRRPSRKRSASPSSYDERWGSSSPGRESVSSVGRTSGESYVRPVDSRPARTSMDSHRPSIDARIDPARPVDSRSNRPSIDSRHSTDSFPRPASADEERPRSKSSLSHLLDGDGQGGMRAPAGSARPTGKRGSISTALASMQLKSATTSRASSPGTTRSSARAGTNAHAWPTFGAVGESMAMGPDVWRHETEADMRRREAEAEERKRLRQGRVADVEMENGEARQGEVEKRNGAAEKNGELDTPRREVDLHRRKSEGAKRRRIGAEDDTLMEPDVSIVEQIRRASDEGARRTAEEAASRRASEGSRRSLGEDASKRADEARRTGDKPARRGTGDNTGRRATGNARRATGDEPTRQGSVQMPGAWVAEERGSAIVVSDSPELQSNDRMVLEADAPKDALISGPVEAKDGPTKNAGEGSSAKDEAPARKASAREASAKAKRSPSLDGRKGSTPPTSDVFQHIWPPPVLETKKGRKSKVEPEPVPPRSFITQRNLSVAPAPSTEEDTKDGAKDGSANKDAGSSLRSMLTTMPSRAVFLSAVQTFLAQPKRRGRAVVMTKALMKDALAVLLDPNTEDMLKDYVPPEQLKDEDKSSRGGTPAGRKSIDTSDHTTLEFRAWAKRMFSTVKTARGEEVLAFAGKPVVVEDDIYETIVLSHSKGNHCGAEETVRLVDQAHSWVPRALVEAFVQECPGCPASNKMSNTATKPKKRKWVRKEDKAAAATTRRKPATRRGKRGGQAQEAGKRRKGKEASPADESEGEVENENEEQEQELEGEQEQEQEQEQEMEEDELGEDVVQDEPEEDEMESEDEQVARPAATVASSVPMQDKMDVDESG